MAFVHLVGRVMEREKEVGDRCICFDDRNQGHVYPFACGGRERRQPPPHVNKPLREADCTPTL